jgi:hypothetical protein
MLPGFGLAMFVAASGLVVPSPANWDDVGDGFSPSGFNSSINIGGINEPIALRVTTSSGSSYSGGSASLSSLVQGVSQGIVSVRYADTLDFWVNPGDAVRFSASGSGGVSWTCGCTVTVKYKSLGSPTFDQTLDTFAVALGFPV